MISKSKFPNSADKYVRCPLPQTHRRLIEAHLLWHQTLDRYSDPEAFRANLNATIEASETSPSCSKTRSLPLPNLTSGMALGKGGLRLMLRPNGCTMHGPRSCTKES
jgi:hypothetical protein